MVGSDKQGKELPKGNSVDMWKDDGNQSPCHPAQNPDQLGLSLGARHVLPAPAPGASSLQQLMLQILYFCSSPGLGHLPVSTLLEGRWLLVQGGLR